MNAVGMTLYILKSICDKIRCRTKNKWVLDDYEMNTQVNDHLKMDGLE